MTVASCNIKDMKQDHLDATCLVLLPQNLFKKELEWARAQSKVILLQRH